MLADHYNRYQASDRYERLLFRSGRGLQSAELNEIQSQAFEQTKSLADALLKEGDLVGDGQIVVQHDSATALLEAGKIYLRGMVRNVPANTVNIDLTSVVDVGVWLSNTTVTELEDGNLRDPASATRNYNEPGAARLQYHCVWGLSSDNDKTGDFFPVYKVDHGVVLIKQPPPQLDSVTVALARYDKESNGSYVVEGLRALYLSTKDNQQHFTISEGKAHVDGLEIAAQSALRKAFVINPQRQSVLSEPHQFVGDGQKVMRINLSQGPVAEVKRINGALEKTVNLQRGLTITDPLPDNSVYQIVSITQADTTYVEGTDFDLTSNNINWGAAGAEPASGSTYSITYRYRADVAPFAVDETGFSVSHLVDNEVLFVDYDWKLPRIDLLTIDPEGVIRRIEGIAHPWQPKAPAVPSGQLVLAQIQQHWSQHSAPKVSNVAVRVVPMAELESMQQQIADLYDLVAIERLRNDANITEPVAKKGVFVDPFLDDDLRDQGISQTAAIIDGELQLPIDGNIEQLGLNLSEAQTLPYGYETILSQSMRTGQMKVNPYQAFEPMPATVSLSPAQDRWTEVNDNWLSTITRRFVGRRNLDQLRSTNTTQVVSQRQQQVQFLRPRSIEFTIDGFGPNEQLSSVEFDGLTLNVEQI